MADPHVSRWAALCGIAGVVGFLAAPKIVEAGHGGCQAGDSNGCNISVGCLTEHSESRSVVLIEHLLPDGTVVATGTGVLVNNAAGAATRTRSVA